MNMQKFVESQKKVIKVGINNMFFNETTIYAPIFQTLLQLKSLVEVLTNSSWPDYPFQNPNVQKLRILMLDVDSCLRRFPGIVSLEILFDSLAGDDVILAINNLKNLRNFTIKGDARNAGQRDAFLEKLLIKNLEKVTFLRYPERNCRVQFYDRFTRNHPKIKEFKIEADDFGMGAVRVIVRNLENLEKFVFETEDSKFEWDLEKLNDFRKICDC